MCAGMEGLAVVVSPSPLLGLPSPEPEQNDNENCLLERKSPQQPGLFEETALWA